jgi:hypothetical protein
VSDQGWSSVSYLDALRPEPGWRVDFALLASYSVNLVALVAALLGLAGLDDDHGSGSKVDFANAIQALRDRVRILVQAGQAVAPSQTPKILVILDQFVRQVPMNEEDGSWHPKVALVRLGAKTERGAVQWRPLVREPEPDPGCFVGRGSRPSGKRIERWSINLRGC